MAFKDPFLNINIARLMPTEHAERSPAVFNQLGRNYLSSQ